MPGVRRTPHPWLLCAALIAAPAAAEPPASELFGAHRAPSQSSPAAYGTYAKGCLAGGMELPETAPGWQAMRLSRNRNWGHPETIAFIDRLSVRAREVGWPRLYVGDIGQPRGGPMRSGHRSHQIGLDVDIWLRRPDGRELDRAEREQIGSYNVVAANGVGLNDNWTPEHHAIIRAAAEDPAVARIFVNAAIKRGMCLAERGPGGIDAPWLRKVRPWKGHDHHFHVRLACPQGAPRCQDQGPPAPGDGCGAELANWFPKGALAANATVGRQSEEAPERPATRSLSGELTLADLPDACRAVHEDDAAALASIAPYVPQAVMAAPVFFAEQAEAHTGFVGTAYHWTPPVDLNAAEQRRVALTLDGELPPGLGLQDRGGGNAVVTGVPEAEGEWTFAITAHERDDQQGRLAVTLAVETLRAETAEAAKLPSLEHQVRDFVTNFTGDECFLATPVAVAEARIEIEAYADEAAPFYVFDDAFETALGSEAQIGGRLVTRAQCEALAFARAFPHGDPPQVTLSDPDHALAPGQPLEAVITGEAVRYITLLLVRPDGSVVDLSDYLRREGAELTIAVIVQGRGPHLLVAVDTVFPLVKPDFLMEGKVNDIFANLRAGNTARSFDMKTSLAYFVIG
jgi:penicillin-insensitive murein DD-endopeptidase